MEQRDRVLRFAERPIFIGIPKERAHAIFARCVISPIYEITSSLRARDDGCYNPVQMTVNVRQMRSEEAQSFLEVLRAAVRGIAARDYPPSIVESWAPLPITDEAIERVLANPEKELRIVAEVNGEIVGIGAIVIETSELRACYVAPKAARMGIGSALVSEIERIAREHGVTCLHLDSSITAEPFYRALGYEVQESGEHILSSGERMACVKMRKRLRR